MRKSIIQSKEYHKLMQGDWDIRHNIETQKDYGVWRWKGMYDNRESILKELEGKEIMLDIGGALAPLGFGSVIIDQKMEDINGNPVLFQSIKKVPSESCHIIFSSHYLEHIKMIDVEVYAWWQRLKKGGKLILHVPSIYNRRYWHPDVKEEHYWIFALSTEDIINDRKELYIDLLIKKWFDIEFMQHVGDSSILMIGRKWVKE